MQKIFLFLIVAILGIAVYIPMNSYARDSTPIYITNDWLNFTITNLTKVQIENETDPFYHNNSLGYYNASKNITDVTDDLYYPLNTNPHGYFNSSDNETDPVYSAWDKSTGITITESQITDLTNHTLIIWALINTNPFNYVNDTSSFLTSETDPLWSGNQSNYYTRGDIESFSYVNDTSSFLTSESDPYYNSNPLGYVNDTSSFLTSEQDPLWQGNVSNYYTRTEIEGFDYVNDTSSFLTNDTDANFSTIYVDKICFGVDCSGNITDNGTYIIINKGG